MTDEKLEYVDQMVGAIKLFGIARGNQFRVTIHNLDKLLEDRYKYPNDKSLGTYIPKRLTIMCDGAELPTKQLNLSSGRFRKMPTEQVYDNLPLTFKIGADGLERRVFDLWMAYIIDVYSDYVEYQVNYTTIIDIELLNPRFRKSITDPKATNQERALAIESESVYKIRLVDAYPMTVGATQLQSTSGGEFITQSVTFAYRFWDIITPEENKPVSQPLREVLKPTEPTNTKFDLKKVTTKITNVLDKAKGLLSLNQGETLNLYNKVNDYFTKNTGLSINDAKRWTEQTKRDIEAITDEDVLSNANKLVLVGGLADILGLLPKP